MTQTQRGRARTTTRGRRRHRDVDYDQQQEELIGTNDKDTVHDSDHKKHLKAHAPCKSIYVPPTLQQGMQGRDDRKSENYKPYSSSSDGDSPRRANEEQTRNQIDTPNGIRRVPSVVQDLDDRHQSRRLRAVRRHVDEEEELHSLPSSYHRSPKAQQSAKCKKQGKPLDRRTRRLPDPPIEKHDSDSGIEYGPTQPQQLLSTLSDDSSFEPSKASSDEHRNPEDTSQYQRSYSEGVSSETGTFDTECGATRSDAEHESRKHHRRLPIFLASVSTMASLESVTSMLDHDIGGPFAFLTSDLSGLFLAKQDVAICTMILSSLELLVLMLQLTMCGIAPFQTNMMIGPFPDAFSLWGGKNPHLMLVENEWWRVVTPSFLSVGMLHFAVNVYCLLRTGALFEREWGWMPWVFFLMVGSIGCSAFSVYFEPETIAVGSSGALLGLYGAKLAQVILQTFCQQAPKKYEEQEDIIPLGYLASVLFSLIIQFALGIFLTYIDFAGSCGGLVAGLAAGIVYFSPSVQGCCSRFFIAMFGLCALIAPIGACGYLFVTDIETNEELGDVCQYFRSLFTEGYECGCMG